jgi:acyl-CoA thioester hydrolase
VDQELLAGFPVVTELPVAWGEMDALGHVNNAVYFRYIESGRMACFSRLGMLDDIPRTGIGPILHSVSCRFRLSLTYPDTISVGTRITDIGDDRFTLESKIVSHRHNRVAAEAQSIIVMLDYRANRKVPLSAGLRKNIAELEQAAR